MELAAVPRWRAWPFWLLSPTRWRPRHPSAFRLSRGGNFVRRTAPGGRCASAVKRSTPSALERHPCALWPAYCQAVGSASLRLGLSAHGRLGAVARAPARVTRCARQSLRDAERRGKCVPPTAEDPKMAVHAPSRRRADYPALRCVPPHGHGPEYTTSRGRLPRPPVSGNTS